MSDALESIEYGFVWGPAEVTRLARFEGRGRVIGVATEHRQLQVAVSEGGRKIRVWLDGQRLEIPT